MVFDFFLTEQPRRYLTVHFKMFWWNWNEQSKSLINSLKRDMRQPIFMKIKIIPLALLEIAASMHSPFCPIWRIFLPVYHRPSKRANGMILIFMKICCLLSPFNEFYIRLLCSFQFHQNILKYTVQKGTKYNTWYAKLQLIRDRLYF